MRYFEDFSEGARFELGQTTVTEADVVEFAARFDPQPLHVDPVRAADGPFGGLVASGWHTCSIFMRLLVDSLLVETAGLGGLGADDLHWKVPVRPADTLRGSVQVVTARRSASRRDAGVVGLRCELVNQRGELVWDAILWSLVESSARSS